jgi:thiamine pyrophosphate-dependent acetolactate synthase large subunit-like protein
MSSVAAQLAAVMVEEGCEHLFTLMGAGNLWLIHHLDAEHGVPVHHLRHENGAIGAADGYARATGRLGWATVTQGPGFTNTITALLTASRGHTPMVLVVSDTTNLDPQRFPFAGGVQALAPELLLEPLGIETLRGSGTDAPRALRAAARQARDESKTIVFIIPAGLDRLEAGEYVPADAAERGRPGRAGAPHSGSSAHRTAPHPRQIAEAADRILAAKRPVILAGRGVLLGEAAEHVVHLAEVLDAPVATSMPACGVLGDHPAVIGPFGGFSIGETERIITESDCLVVIGASLNLFQTRNGRFTTGRTVVRIDLDPEPPPGLLSTPLEPGALVPVAAEASAGTAELAGELERRGRRRGSVKPRLVDPAPDDVSEPGAIDPRHLALEFERLLPGERRVFIDNGHFGAFPALYLRHRAPRSLIWLPDFGAVGSALAAAYASSIADPGARSVLFIGDCGLYLTLGDLETAVRERAPLIVVCMNDGAAGSELAHMKDWGVPPEQAIFGYADLAAVAAGMGAQSALVRELGELEPALDAWRPEEGPLLLDCHISRAVRSPIYDHV